MKQYRVFGHATVTVSVIVQADENLNESELYEKAMREFDGIHAFVGNGGMDKLIGVCGDATIAADEFPTFDDFTDMEEG